MSKIWTVSEGSRSVVDTATMTADAEPRKAHRLYNAVDPQQVASRLEAAGLHVDVAYGNRRRSFLKSAKTAILRVTDLQTWLPSSLGEDYCACAAIYLDHRGRSAIKVNGGPLRMECANQFTSPDLRIHHCSEDALAFLADPASYVRPILASASHKLRRLESLRDVPDGHILPLFVRSVAPRLGARVVREFQIYRQVGGDTWWSALQALTAPSSRRLDEFAGRLLDELPLSLPALSLQAAWN